MRPTTTKATLLILAFMAFALAAYAAPSLSVVSTSPTTNNPTLTANVGTTFSITVNDTSGVNYGWKVNSTVVQNGSSNQFTFTPNSTGQSTINVVAFKTSNTSDSVTHTWNAVIQAGTLGLSVPQILTLGSDSQKPSNRESENSDVHNIFVEKTIRVTNTDANPITGLNVSLEGANGFSIENDLNMTVTLPQTAITAGNFVDVKVRSRVPDQLDAINQSTNKLIAPQIATLTFRAQLSNGSQSLVTTSVNMQRKNMLVIKDIDVCVETDCEDAGADAVIQNVKPGDQVDIEIAVESLYSTGNDEDIDIQDVELSFEVDEDELNDDENEDLGDLGARDEDTHTFSLEVPDDLDSGIYDVLVKVIGRDENGAFHGDSKEFRLDIDRKSHDLTIQSLLINPQNVNLCNQRSFSLTILSQNIGESDEDEGVLIIRNSDLEIDRKIGPFLIEQDNKRTDTLNFNVPSRVSGGQFTLIAKSYFDADKQTDEEGVVINLDACAGQEQNTQPDSGNSQNTSSTQERNGSSAVNAPSPSSPERTLSAPTSSGIARTSRSNSISPLAIFGAIFAALIVLLVVVLVVVKRR